MILMMRCGGLPSFLTVAMSAALIVCNAASASSRAGLAAANFSSATALSAYMIYLLQLHAHTLTNVLPL